jgi:cytochrome P450
MTSGEEPDPFLALKPLHDAPRVFWTPRNGGHWVATRGEDIRKVLSNHEQFSSRQVFIPPSPERPASIQLEIDPPDHEKYRRLIMPAFAPPAIAAWTEQARAFSVWLKRIPEFEVKQGESVRTSGGYRSGSPQPSPDVAAGRSGLRRSSRPVGRCLPRCLGFRPFR